MRSLSFLIPTYGDENSIATAVNEAHREGRRLRIPFEIVVINDHSPDNTARVLTKLTKIIKELRVITHTVNLGYGGTIKELYETGANEWLFTIPGDYQVGAMELRKLIPKTRKADMIVGLRTKRYDSPRRQVQSAFYNMLLRLLFRLPVHDANSVRLMKSEIMKYVALTSTSAFVDAELIIKAYREGFRITEKAISHRKRTGGSGRGGGGRVRTILPTIRDMFRFLLNI